MRQQVCCFGNLLGVIVKSGIADVDYDSTGVGGFVILGLGAVSLGLEDEFLASITRTLPSATMVLSRVRSMPARSPWVAITGFVTLIVA